MEVDMKVIDKGLKGKGHKIPFVKLVGEDGDKLELILDSKSGLSDYQLEEVKTVKVVTEQQRLTLDKE